MPSTTSQTPDANSPEAAKPIFMNPAFSVEERTEDVVNRLTLEEKIDLLAGASYMATKPNARLGLPGFLMTDGPLGTRCNGPSTAYPAGLPLAASWNVELAVRMGEALGRDARARGVHILLAPGMNLYRAPMCGRNFEYLGEDPLVAGLIAAGYIRGVQSQGVAATAKHLLANEQEFDRHHLSSDVDERTLRELYLKPFDIVVKAGVLCVMNSYNPLNGVHASQHDWLNNTILKGEFGFRGLLMSDWASTYDTLGMANGGLDIEMPEGKFFNCDALLPLIRDGKVTESTINDKVRRQFRIAFEMGWLDRPQEDPTIAKDDPQSAAVALEAAREGVVLLKNEGGLLPLDRATVKKIVVLGRNADPAVPGAAGSAFTKPFHSVSVFQGLKDQVDSAANVIRVPWEGPENLIPTEFAEEVRSADVAVVCVGFNDQNDGGADAKRPDSEGEAADRSYSLPPGQVDLIQAVAKLNSKVIVVLNAGGSVATAGWLDKVPVLLHAFYPGQAGGTALAEVVFGAVNPSAKLPFSWERRWEDCAAYGNYPSNETGRTNNYKEGVFLGYRWFDAKGIEPLFPFGHGLSYTTFQYSDLKVDQAKNGDVIVTATLTNTGACEGAEIVQLYVTPPNSDVPRPVRELKGFAKVWLKPGENKGVTISVALDELAYWGTVEHAWLVSHGEYGVSIGSSSRDLRLCGTFSV